MDRGSIDRQSRHIHSVQRLRSELSELDPDDRRNRLEEKIELVQLRWLNCRRNFAMLFMTLNRGNKFPLDSFDIKVDSRQYGDRTYDTYVRVWRDKDHQTYYAKPYINCGSNIIDHGFATETFGHIYHYRYGSCHSQSARIEFESEVDLVEVKLVRINGYLADQSSHANDDILLSALEDEVIPALRETESTLGLLAGSILKEDLNPEHVQKTKIPARKQPPRREELEPTPDA